MGHEFLDDKPWSDNVQDRPNLRLSWDVLATGASGDNHLDRLPPLHAASDEEQDRAEVPTRTSSDDDGHTAWHNE